MWLLSTRGRPKQCQAVINACEAAGMTSNGVVFVDGPTTLEQDDAYRALRLPVNWTLHHNPEHVRLSAQLQWALSVYPSEHYYGWLADDTYPVTHGFDAKLEEAAGPWGYAQCDDMCGDPARAKRYMTGSLLSAGLCWGGNLVRAVGWWGYPEIKHVGTDGVWSMLLKDLGCCTYLEDVKIEHRTWRFNARPRDAIDIDQGDKDPFVEADLAKVKVFRRKHIFPTLERVNQAKAKYEAERALWMVQD